jgi:hypothetical protein
VLVAGDVVVVVLVVGGVVVVVLVGVVVVLVVLLDVGVVELVVLVEVLEVVELEVVCVAVELVWQSRLASAASVLAPWSRLACRVVLIDGGSLATSLLKLVTALVAAPHCPPSTADETASS